MLTSLTGRWTKLRYHPEQSRLWNSSSRFKVVPAGRRSGKTELAKRKLVTQALRGPRNDFYDANYFAGAPTRDQAKRIYWNDLKALIHPRFLARKPKESDLEIELINNTKISVVGMDVPERIEGSPWDGGILDEYANMKAQAWDANIRPALADRTGWCWLIGVPEGRNHYYKMYKAALEDKTGEWDGFHWFSRDILPPDEIESAKKNMDELTFQQEYEGSFVTFQGRVYYPFSEEIHCGNLEYDDNKPLILCFDFNVSPGICAVLQEQKLHYKVNGKRYRIDGTGIINEIYIQKDSNTVKICKKILEVYSDHRSDVICYGDSSGGSKGSAKISGSDWDIIKDELKPYFQDRLRFSYPKKNPSERSRVNSVNSRIMSTSGIVRLMVDKRYCPHIVDDFEGVETTKDGSGEIDKKSNPEFTHFTDAIGYYIHREFPINKSLIKEVKILGI